VRKKRFIAHVTTVFTTAAASAVTWTSVMDISSARCIGDSDNLILDKDKRLISATYGEHSTAAFKTYLSAIREVRNACAHGNVMFGLRLSFGISTGIACPSLKPGTNQSLNGALRVINHMIRQISVIRANDMLDELFRATARLYSKVPDTDIRSMIEKETGIIVAATCTLKKI